MGKLTISMVIFNSYVKLPEGSATYDGEKTLCRWVMLLPDMVDTGCGWRSRFSQVLPGKRKRGTSSWKITRSQAPRSSWKLQQLVNMPCLQVPKTTAAMSRENPRRWIQAPQWEDGPFRAETLVISDQLECKLRDKLLALLLESQWQSPPIGIKNPLVD